MDREKLIAPDQYNIVSEIERFAQSGNRLALLLETENGQKGQLTYKELMVSASQWAYVMKNAGLEKGDAVLIILPKSIEAYIGYVAALKAGLVVIPSSEMLRAKDIEYRLTHGDAKAIIASSFLVSEVEKVTSLSNLHKFVVGESVKNWVNIAEEAKQEPAHFKTADTSRDDVSFLSYTSGTTGNPKGVIHTHGWGYAHLRTAAENWLAVKEGDTVWATAGPGWQKWIWSPFLSVLGMGATGFVYQGKFEPEKYLQLLDQYKISVLCCTPTEYRLMAKVNHLEKYKLSSLHSAVSAGEPLNREVIDTFQQYFNIEVRDGYGQTENTLLLGVMKGMKLKPGSMGKPTPGNRVAIINDEGILCPPGEVGDIAVHIESPALFKNYYKDPERTAKQFRGDYYVTGDKARMDDEGYFWFEGRGDDMIISSGYTIGPFEVEDALVKHPKVKECAVVASPDEIRGSVVKAFVVLKGDIPENPAELSKELQEYVKAHTAPYKYPRKIEYVSDLPKTTSGKIRRVELRQKELVALQNSSGSVK
ncbi:acetyl-CoA synthetase [Bacillus oleivorans]|uniref:Acetyl-CoA synthetase n=1 Tax=Bacillus oleivorans TaxID=1448271 RepID=A0A285CV22_9BACI|nr:acyl--CoA ligase [Bacillus oleivorans]SNX71407.1 acetyl-CoA synthetase [Bacillus oleivorans]